MRLSVAILCCLVVSVICSCGNSEIPPPQGNPRSKSEVKPRAEKSDEPVKNPDPDGKPIDDGQISDPEQTEPETLKRSIPIGLQSAVRRNARNLRSEVRKGWLTRAEDVWISTRPDLLDIVQAAIDEKKPPFEIEVTDDLLWRWINYLTDFQTPICVLIAWGSGSDWKERAIKLMKRGLQIGASNSIADAIADWELDQDAR